MLQALLDHASYAPHGYCLFWQPWLITLHASADILIFLAYSAIPIALLLFLRRRPEIRYRGLVALFAAFILLCGVTHLVSVVTLWIPIYPVQGVLKMATALVSAVTAVVLFLLIPALAKIPSPGQLEDSNRRLRDEIAAHKVTLDSLRAAQLGLEQKVAQRTIELSAANERLNVATREAVHRARNLLAVVLAVARQTARGTAELAEFLPAFIGRIDALSAASAAVMADPTRKGSVLLGDVVRRQLAPMLQTFGPRITLDGPDIEIEGDAAQNFSLAVHELATNCVKHGALSQPEGEVALTWRVDPGAEGDEVSLVWQESATQTRPEVEQRPGGFGQTLLQRLLPGMLSGEASSDMTASGLRYALRVPLSKIAFGQRTSGTTDLDLGALA